jgi:glycosyltransferase involved in cell wall biosynthesis
MRPRAVRDDVTDVFEVASGFLGVATAWREKSVVRMTERKSVVILGTRGVPAAHGGFETFAEHLALFLVERGWHVAVYCQHDVAALGRKIWTDEWRGVERVNIEVTEKGPVGTLAFDWRSIVDATRRDSVCLVLGYNSAVFLPYLRLRGGTVITNMDGLEWRRQKWSRPVRAWFWVNEWIAAWTSHHLVADHPAIADHLATRRSRRAITMIPYGGDPVDAMSDEPVRLMGLIPNNYLVSIARIEPENNILPMVEAFSRKTRNARLVVLGTFSDDNPYHHAVKAAASAEVLFPGAIYEPDRVRALRFHARAYLHGHTVGGTNPSLVEALWAGNAIIAHDNAFNRWTAGPEQAFFANADACERIMSALLDDDGAVARAGVAARRRAETAFDWHGVLRAYEDELLAAGGAKPMPASPRTSTPWSDTPRVATPSRSARDWRDLSSQDTSLKG